jgi:predicted NUDIX family phosphoesterase
MANTEKQASPSRNIARPEPVEGTGNQEQILVIRRDLLFPDGAWHGLKVVDFTSYLHLIMSHKEFNSRTAMETDPTYKQIIPYLIFEHNNRYFLMQRAKKASETRLQSKFTLGIGGHIRKEDMQTDSLFDWATREFHEEVNYSGKLNIEPLGILNDDSNEVGKVHVGFVLLLRGSSEDISVKSELANGELYCLEECNGFYDRMESWSQMVMDHIKARAK